MHDLIPFTYNDTPVRVVTIDGEPWFVLNDLARVLGLTRSASQIKDRLDKGVRQTYPLPTAGGTQHTTIVSEAGMYEVVIRSDKPEAAAFRRWITSEVLPSIRKTGGYGVARELTPDEIVHEALQITARRIEALTATVERQEARLAIVQPKADAFDRWLSSNAAYAVGEVAKAIAVAGVEIGRQRLFQLMGCKRPDGLGWTYRDASGRWQPYQSQIETKRLTVQLGTQLNTRTGEEFATSTVRITPKGVVALAVALGAAPELVAEALETIEGEAA